MTKEEYNRNLKERQQRHLDNVFNIKNPRKWKPCMHDQCTRCHGTGIDSYGKMCIHSLYCNCPKCSVSC